MRGGLGIGSIAPLVIRGEAPVLGWAPQSLPKAEDSTATRILDLYRHTDPALAAALSRGLATDKMASRSGLSGDGVEDELAPLGKIGGLRFVRVWEGDGGSEGSGLG